jgi:hypothetical protein
MQNDVVATQNDALGGAVLIALAAIDRAATDRGTTGLLDANPAADAARCVDVLTSASTLHLLYDVDGTRLSTAAQS